MAEFQVVLREGAAQSILYDRVLRPGEVQCDEGLQSLDIPLPAAAPGSTLILNAVSKTPMENGETRACRTDVRFRGEWGRSLKVKG